MKKQFTHLIFLFFLLNTVVSCENEPLSKSFRPFYELAVNGSKKSVEACGTSDLVAEYLQDTAIYARLGCGGQRAGFYIKGNITDDTYQLDNKNQAWYELGSLTFTTDSQHTGTLTIRTKNYQAPGGSIPYIEGEISFDGIDKNTGQTTRVTNGKYLLRKYQF